MPGNNRVNQYPEIINFRVDEETKKAIMEETGERKISITVFMRELVKEYFKMYRRTDD